MIDETGTLGARTIAFVVTKPLQLVFAFSLIRQLAVADKSVLIITNDFKNAESVCEKIRQLEWEFSAVKVQFCAIRSQAEQAAMKLGVKQLFVDSDVGLQRFLLLLRTQITNAAPEIWVYEEGHGTYRTDIYRDAIKCSIFKFIGIGTHFGENRFTHGIYVREPEVYCERFPQNKLEVRQIQALPSETIGRHLEEWRKIFSYTPVRQSPNKSCAVYLTDWAVREEGLAKLARFPGDKFMKPHPHIKTTPAVRGIEMISATAPAELVLMDLLANYTQVTVLHHGSSCERYVTNERMTFVRI